MRIHDLVLKNRENFAFTCTNFGVQQVGLHYTDPSFTQRMTADESIMQLAINFQLVLMSLTYVAICHVYGLLCRLDSNWIKLRDNCFNIMHSIVLSYDKHSCCYMASDCNHQVPTNLNMESPLKTSCKHNMCFLRVIYGVLCWRPRFIIYCSRKMHVWKGVQCTHTGCPKKVCTHYNTVF